MDISLAQVVVSTAAVVLAWRYMMRDQSSTRFLPVFGNLLDIPKKHEWLIYAEWAKKYGQSGLTMRRSPLTCFCYRTGDVVYIEVLGRPMVFLGSLRSVTEMFEKRGANCSDRPPSTMVQL
jgi:hypothetical protein